MASATIAEARVEQWTADQLRGINFIKRWVALFGEPPRAADLNPSAARNSGQEWRIERYAAGDPETGAAFLALNTLKKPFGGSLNRAIVAAGFAVAKPGPRRRAEIRGREIDVQRLGVHPDVRVAMEAARADVRALAAKLETSDRRLTQARERLAAAAEALAASRAENAILRKRLERSAAAAAPKPTVKTKVVRARVVDEAAAARVRERAAKAVANATAKAEASRAGEREARTMAARLAARLERSEATVTKLRGEKAQLRDAVADRDRVGDRAVAAEYEIEELREQVSMLRARPPVAHSVERDAVQLAEREQVAAERRARESELRAVRAERELRETVALVRGEARRLTAREIAELRGEGPAGPALLARAIDGVVRARRAGNPPQIKRALRELSEASETYRGRMP